MLVLWRPLWKRERSSVYVCRTFFSQLAISINCMQYLIGSCTVKITVFFSSNACALIGTRLFALKCLYRTSAWSVRTTGRWSKQAIDSNTNFQVTCTTELIPLKPIKQLPFRNMKIIEEGL